MKNIITSAVVALVVALLVVGLVGGKSTKPLGGITNYDQIAIGTTSPAFATQELIVGGAATTTANVTTTATTAGSCLQMTTVTGGTVRIFISGTTQIIQAGTCK